MPRQKAIILCRETFLYLYKNPVLTTNKVLSTKPRILFLSHGNDTPNCVFPQDNYGSHSEKPNMTPRHKVTENVKYFCAVLCSNHKTYCTCLILYVYVLFVREKLDVVNNTHANASCVPSFSTYDVSTSWKKYPVIDWTRNGAIMLLCD